MRPQRDLKTIGEGPESSTEEPQSPEKDAESSTVASHEPSAFMDSTQPKITELDSADAELERRIVEAELAGRSTVADVLARQLEARRANGGAGLVDLASEQATRGRS